MSLQIDLMIMSKEARPRIRKLAGEQKLVDECFNEFQRETFPTATTNQIEALRMCYFAGAETADLALSYAVDAATDEGDEGNLDMWSNARDEIAAYHQNFTGRLPDPPGDEPKG